MRLDDCYRLGEVIKTHGLKGEVGILLDVDFPEDYQHLESVFLHQNGRLVPFFIERIQLSGARGLVGFEDVNDRDSARALIGRELYLPVIDLPALKEGQYYFHDLIGCEVFEKEQKIGKVTSIYDLPGNELMAVKNGETEILIPLKEEMLSKVDHKAKTIEVKLPEGLLDLYTEAKDRKNHEN